MAGQGLPTKGPIDRSSSVSAVGARPEGALRITRAEPAGYAPGESPPAGTPIWVTWGTVGGLIPPPELFTTPIGYVTATGTRYVWAKIGASNTAVMVATSLAFVTDPSPTAYATDDFAEDGTPPAFIYVPLAQIVVTGAGPDWTITINNGGSGSVVPAMHLANVVEDEEGAIQSFTRNLSFWRTPDA